MTKNKRYDYSELKDGTYGIFKDKYYDDNDISFSMRLCEVTNEEQARTIVGQLNGLVDENEELKKENKFLRCTIESNSQDDYINYLKKQNEQLKKELFEARKDYLIETADISDKLYLEDEIEEERKEIFGDNND